MAMKGCFRRMGVFLAGWAAVPLYACVSLSTPSFTAVGTGSLGVQWSTICSTGTVYYTQISTDSGFAVPAESSNTLNPFAAYGSAAPLTPNTTYHARVSTVPALSPFLLLGSTATLAATPGIPASPFSGGSSTTFTVGWSSGTAGPGFNPAGTFYRIEVSTLAGFVPLFQFFDTSGLSQAFTGLAADTTYHARVRTVNHNGVTTAYAALGSVVTDSSSPLDHTQSQTVSTNGGTIELTVPAGTFAEDYFVRLNTAPLTQPLESPALSGAILEANRKITTNHADALRRPLSGGLVEAAAFNSSGQSIGASARNSVTISIAFTDAGGVVAGTTPPVRSRTLAIHMLDAASGLWIRLPGSEVDVAAGLVTALIPRPGVLALIGRSDGFLEDAYAYPVPFQPALGHRSITFVNLSQPATIRIFTVGGRLVQTLQETDGDARLDWNVRSAEGNMLAAGVYYYVIESPSDKKTGKLMVIR